jgi:hypothetical protein
MRIPLVLLLGFWGLLTLAPAAAAEAPPVEIAGFALGADRAQVQARLKPETALAIRFAEHLEEVETQPLPGFKSGLITFGTCAGPGRVVRIKLKYADSSRAFFDALLTRLEARFGKPDEWQGDPFHVVIAWKWSFTDAAGRRFTLNLQHNTRDAEEKLGNAIKLTAISAIEAEADCFAERFPDFRRGDPGAAGSKAGKAQDWDWLLPR